MTARNIISRRDFIAAVTVLSAAGMAACAATSQQSSRLWTADRGSSKLPPRGEFVVRNAYIVTMDPKLGDIPNGDVHVRDGALVAVGANLNAPNAEVIDGRNRIACPGFVDTHFHLWGSFARGVVADGEFDYFPVMSKLGPVMTPEDAYASARLGITEAIYSGLTTIHDWSHNIIDGRYADADLRALRDCGIRARFSYGYSRNLQQKPKETADFNDIARVKGEWFGAANDGLLTLGFASRGAGDTPPEVYRKEWEFARSLGLPITQHAGPPPAPRRRRSDAADDPLMAALRAWRLERAREDAVPAYVVAHDATLEAISEARPTSLPALRRVKGMGPSRIDRYGDEIVAIVNSVGRD